MIDLKKEGEFLFLNYSPYFDIDKINAKLGISFAENDTIIELSKGTLSPEMIGLRGSTHVGFSLLVKRIFFFDRTDLVYDSTEEGSYIFVLGTLEDDYYRIEGRIFGISQDVLMHKSINFNRKLFCTGYEGRTSIIGKIGQLVDDKEREIIIGGGI